MCLTQYRGIFRNVVCLALDNLGCAMTSQPQMERLPAELLCLVFIRPELCGMSGILRQVCREWRNEVDSRVRTKVTSWDAVADSISLLKRCHDEGGTLQADVPWHLICKRAAESANEKTLEWLCRMRVPWSEWALVWLNSSGSSPARLLSEWRSDLIQTRKIVDLVEAAQAECISVISTARQVPVVHQRYGMDMQLNDEEDAVACMRYVLQFLKPDIEKAGAVDVLARNHENYAHTISIGFFF